MRIELLAGQQPAEVVEAVADVLVDCVAGLPNARHRAEVSKLLVHRSARGRGAATALMSTVEDAALGSAARPCCWTPSPAALPRRSTSGADGPGSVSWRTTR